MDFDLSPKFAKPAYQEEGGSFDVWYNSDFPLLGETKIGAGRLVLQPRGFVIPHYGDSSKIGYVLEGTEGRLGLVFPNSSKEVVVKLKKGDVVPVPHGVLSWWYNSSADSDLVLVFLGETFKSYVLGQPTYFLLSGVEGNLAGFSSEFTARAYKLNEQDANKLAKSQKAALIVKADAAKQLPQPCKDSTSKLVYNMETTPPDVNVNGGGTYKTITAAIFPFLEEVGLSVSHLKLDANAMFSPTYTADGSARAFYVPKGSGRVQVVGIGGKQVLDSKIVAGQLLIVPRYFVLAVIADSEGLEFVSILNTTSPAVEELATKKSGWNALSPVVSQVALNVTPEFEELFRSNIKKSSILIPPSE